MGIPTTSPSLTAYIFRHVKPFWKTLCLLVMLGVADTLEPVMNAMIIQRMVDIVTSTVGDTVDLWSQLRYYVVSFVCLKLALEIIWRLCSYFVECKMLPVVRMNIVNDGFGQVLNKPYDFFQTHYAGQLSTNMATLAKHVPQMVINVHQLFICALLVVFSIISLSRVDLGITMLLLGWILSFVVLVLIGNQAMKKYAHDFSAKEAKSYGKVVDALQNMLTIKLLSRKREERVLMHGVLDEARVAEEKVGWVHLMVFLVLSALYLVMQAGNLWLLVRGREEGRITSGHFVRVFFLNNVVMAQFWFNIRRMLLISKMVGECKQALQALGGADEGDDAGRVQTLRVDKGSIAYDNVCFQYPNQTQPVFTNVCLDIPAGQKVGLVGPSGAGKSTLIRLLLGLYPITQGAIRVDGQSISEATLASLRGQVGLVPQNPVLFHRSVLDNIRCAKPHATQDEVVMAAKKAKADAFIQAMPQGYDTWVGEGGSTLSGGQRQRIAIARIILQDPKIVVLDEATSALDSVTEHLIETAIEDLIQDKTTLVIAHRLSTLRKMDRLVVMQQGKVVEEGTHEALLAQKGAYHTLWDTQVNGFVGDAAS